jgi:hypothetical protein
MATYYVRNDGNNANSGTGSGTGQAWQTLAYALGASSGFASGDTLWIAPGVYRELVVLNIASPSAATYIKGDPTASQFAGVSPGIVRWTNYTTSDSASPSAGALCDLNNRSYMNFSGIFFEHGPSTGNAPSIIMYTSTTSCRYQSFTDCVIYSASQKAFLSGTITSSSSAINSRFDTTIDRCIHIASGQALINIQAVSPVVGTDIPVNIFVRSTFMWYSGVFFNVSNGGNFGTHSGPYECINCTLWNSYWYALWPWTPVTSSNVRNNLFVNGNVTHTTTGTIVENYNVFHSSTRNVPAGANSIVGLSGMEMFQERKFGIYSYLLGYLINGSNAIGVGDSTYLQSGGDVFTKTYSSPPSVGAIEYSTVSSGGIIVAPGMSGGMNG